MKTPYLLFARKLFLFLLGLIIVDVVLGKVLEHYFLKINAGETSRINYSVNNANQEMIILGSSRASHHYNTKILEDSLGLTCYNAGQDGESILYHYGILKCVLKRTKPKNIILDFNVNEFVQSDISYNRLSYLLPHYSRHTEIQQIVNLRSPFENIKALSNLYRYNSYLLPIIANNVMHRKETAYNGYLPLDGHWKKHLGEKIGFTEGGNLDSIKIASFKSLITEARQTDCNIVVLVSPFFQEFGKVPRSVKIAEEICKQQGVRFIDYSQSSSFLQHKEYFSDIEHLNRTGSEVYSKMILSLFNNSVQRDSTSLHRLAHI
jgi:hypothetical protein